MPAAAALDQVDAAAGIMLGELGQRRGDVAIAGIVGDFLDAERRCRSEQRGFHRPGKLVQPELIHHDVRSKMGANASSWAMSTRPRRASSSAATKLEARAERRNCGSWVGGRNASRCVQSSLVPSI